jgi:hypothetical protein
MALLNERVVTIQPSLVRALGNLNKAAVLQQIHWHDKTRDGSWVKIGARELGEEIGLSESQINYALGQLLELGVIVYRHAENHDRRRELRVDHNALADHLSNSTDEQNTHLSDSTDASGEFNRCKSQDQQMDKEEREEAKNAARAKQIQVSCEGFSTKVAAAQSGSPPTVTSEWTHAMVRLSAKYGAEYVDAVIGWIFDRDPEGWWRARMVDPMMLERNWAKVVMQQAKAEGSYKGVGDVPAAPLAKRGDPDYDGPILAPLLGCDDCSSGWVEVVLEGELTGLYRECPACHRLPNVTPADYSDLHPKEEHHDPIPTIPSRADIDD